MSVWTTAADGTAPSPEPSGGGGGRVLPAALTVLACAGQAVVFLFTFLMGLQWGGLTYLAAVAQAGLAFVVIARLAGRRRRSVILVPVVSAALTAALAAAGQAHGRATACSDQELAAAQQLAPPPGAAVRFEGEYIEGCVARTRMSLSNQAILEHYQAEFVRLGWRETPGLHEGGIGTAAAKDGIRLSVAIDSGEEAGAQMLEVLVGDATSATGCVVNALDHSLQRTPTGEVEPGQWTVLASTSQGPASVVIRDSAAAVVFEQPAQPRPEDVEDLLRNEEVSGGTPTLPLEEGDYQVECRPVGDAATTVPLQVAWADPAQAQQEKSLVLRVFETPDDEE